MTYTFTHKPTGQTVTVTVVKGESPLLALAKAVPESLRQSRLVDWE